MKDSIVQTLRVSCLPTGFVRDLFFVEVHVFYSVTSKLRAETNQYSCKVSVIFVRF
jgi:hypothetical protein